ncbi:Calx-beta domain-containing protein [Phenylobacterium sp.]|uniref:Calx-beta domain-containing protein n=1 Tax=Phenylobacterium sp. TaxID=1871053 RepID=UPI0035AF7A75
MSTSTTAAAAGAGSRIAIQSTPRTAGENNAGDIIFSFGVMRADDLSQATTVRWQVSGDGPNPVSASDFPGGVFPSGEVTFAPGQREVFLQVPFLNDSQWEPDEGFKVTLTEASNGTIVDAVATMTVKNDDPGPYLAFGSATAPPAEGDTGYGEYAFTVQLGRAQPDASTTVNWSVEGSGASPASGLDFLGGILPSGTLTFAPGETSKIIVVRVAGDTEQEAPEGFTVRLHDASFGPLSPAPSISGTIRNDDEGPAGVRFAPEPAGTSTPAKPEGGGNVATVFEYAVERTGEISTPVSVAWSVSGWGSAPANGADFVGGALPAGVLQFAPGEAMKTIRIEVAGDTAREEHEQFRVTLSLPVGATLGDAAREGVIRNDDSLPTLGFTTSSVSLAEGNSGATAFTFTVGRSGDLSGAASVYWRTGLPGQGTAGKGDFVGETDLVQGELVFAPGETTKTITLEVAGDELEEGDETFELTLYTPRGAELGDGSAQGVIRNDDNPPKPQVITSPAPGSALTGGEAGDTFHALAGDTLTGRGGPDVFSLRDIPSTPATVTDFTLGSDRLGL